MTAQPIFPRARRALPRRLAALALAATMTPLPAAADLLDRLGEAGTRALHAAEAQAPGAVEIRDDADTPAANAVVRVGRCTGTLIAPDLVLTVGHCAPRAGQAGPEPHPDCAALPQQAGLARFPQAAPDRWLPVHTDHPRSVAIGARRDAPALLVRAAAVALPRCADLALIRLATPVPADIARPLPVMTRPPFSADRLLGAGPLRHAGWGVPPGLAAETPLRQTGPVRYWGATACTLSALPPLRANGRRIVSGDSGSPLLLDTGGEEVVVAVLFAHGLPDPGACGLPAPLPPARHGTYTPTWRPPVPGTGATDIGAWLRQMAPEADHR